MYNIKMLYTLSKSVKCITTCGRYENPLYTLPPSSL